jgi:hypothetical protein
MRAKPYTFASETKVPAAQTRAEIEKLLGRYRASHIAYMAMPDRAILGFRLNDRMVRFTVPMPDQDKMPQKFRSRWRALLLCVKAKLESVGAGIETFDEAFMPHVVMPDGKTLGEHALPQIESAYKQGKMPPMLTFG